MCGRSFAAGAGAYLRGGGARDGVGRPAVGYEGAHLGGPRLRDRLPEAAGDALRVLEHAVHHVCGRNRLMQFDWVFDCCIKMR